MDVSKQIIELNNLVGLDNFLNTINTHTPRFTDRKTKLGWTTEIIDISLL